MSKAPVNPSVDVTEFTLLHNWLITVCSRLDHYETNSRDMQCRLTYCVDILRAHLRTETWQAASKPWKNKNGVNIKAILWNFQCLIQLDEEIHGDIPKLPQTAGFLSLPQRLKNVENATVALSSVTKSHWTHLILFALSVQKYKHNINTFSGILLWY